MSFPRPLSSRRKIPSTRGWSKTNNLLQNSSFDDFVKDESTKSYKNTSKSGLSTPRDSYEASKRAFDVSQKQKINNIKSIENKHYKKDAVARQTRNAVLMKQLPPKPTLPLPNPLRDNHVLEDVISSRNDEYIQASHYLPKGYVLDISATRALPPDRHNNGAKLSSRTYYWG